jgi:hypothetical protein
MPNTLSLQGCSNIGLILQRLYDELHVAESLTRSNWVSRLERNGGGKALTTQMTPRTSTLNIDNNNAVIEDELSRV